MHKGIIIIIIIIIKSSLWKFSRDPREKTHENVGAPLKLVSSGVFN